MPAGRLHQMELFPFPRKVTIDPRYSFRRPSFFTKAERAVVTKLSPFPRDSYAVERRGLFRRLRDHRFYAGPPYPVAARGPSPSSQAEFIPRLPAWPFQALRFSSEETSMTSVALSFIFHEYALVRGEVTVVSSPKSPFSTFGTRRASFFHSCRVTSMSELRPSHFSYPP